MNAKVIPLFTDETTPLVGRFPVAEILPFIRRAECDAAGPYSWDHGRNALARRFADASGGDPQSWVRLLERIKSGKSFITTKVADKLACALGLHPSLIWPEWFRFEHDEAS